ncbi:MAG TPA: CRISPR-associated endonuclease Cas2 [Methylophilaceae bacterium]
MMLRLQFNDCVALSFCIRLDPAQWALLKSRLCGLIDHELDSLRFYFLGSNWQRRIEHIGAKPVPDLNGPLIF